MCAREQVEANCKMRHTSHELRSCQRQEYDVTKLTCARVAVIDLLDCRLLEYCPDMLLSLDRLSPLAAYNASKLELHSAARCLALTNVVLALCGRHSLNRSNQVLR